MGSVDIISVRELSKLLKKLNTDIGDYQVWLSSDEEGNNFQPMLQKPKYSLAIDNNQKRIVLFPSDCLF